MAAANIIWLVTLYYQDGEKFSRTYTDHDKTVKFAARRRKSTVIQRSRVQSNELTILSSRRINVSNRELSAPFYKGSDHLSRTDHFTRLATIPRQGLEAEPEQDQARSNQHSVNIAWLRKNFERRTTPSLRRQSHNYARGSEAASKRRLRWFRNPKSKIMFLESCREGSGNRASARTGDEDGSLGCDILVQATPRDIRPGDDGCEGIRNIANGRICCLSWLPTEVFRRPWVFVRQAQVGRARLKRFPCSLGDTQDSPCSIFSISGTQY